MNCQDFEHAMNDYFDQPSEERNAVLEPHRAACDDCRELFQTYSTMFQALAPKPPAPLAPHFEARVMARIQAQLAAEKPEASYSAAAIVTGLVGVLSLPLAAGSVQVFSSLGLALLLKLSHGVTGLVSLVQWGVMTQWILPEMTVVMSRGVISVGVVFLGLMAVSGISKRRKWQLHS